MSYGVSIWSEIQESNLCLYLGKIMFLLPVYIHINDEKTITLAIAIEKNENGTYRANTIFDLDTAYKKARLVTKPESNWLIP